MIYSLYKPFKSMNEAVTGTIIVVIVRKNTITVLRLLFDILFSQNTMFTESTTCGTITCLLSKQSIKAHTKTKSKQKKSAHLQL